MASSESPESSGPGSRRSKDIYSVSVMERDPSELPYNGPADERESAAREDVHLVRLWLAEKSPKTQTEYATDVEQFVDFVDLPLRYVTLGHLQAYRLHLAEDRNYARSTQRRKLAAVKSLFTFGTRLQYFRQNVAAAVSTPRSRNTKADRILTEAELWAVLESETDLRNHVLLRLFYASGGRVSDLEDLRWRDLKDRSDLAGSAAADHAETRDRPGSTRSTSSRGTSSSPKPAGQVTFFGKREKTRAVNLYGVVWELLMELRQREEAAGFGGASDPVFRSRENNPLSRSMMWHVVKDAATRAGVKLEERTDENGQTVRDDHGRPVRRSAVSPHWFRHAHASHALHKGADLELVRQTLGHESIETTQSYLHVQPEVSSSFYLEEPPDTA